MEFVSGTHTSGMPMPPGVTAITDLKNQKRANKTLSKAVSLHLEGKLESAARLLSKAVEDGERDAGLFAALGHIQYEMHDFAGGRHHLCRPLRSRPQAPHRQLQPRRLPRQPEAVGRSRGGLPARRRRRRHPLRIPARAGHRADPRRPARPKPSSRSKSTSASSPITSRPSSARPSPCSRPASTPNPSNSIARCWPAIPSAKRRSPTSSPCSWTRRTTPASGATRRCSPRSSPIPPPPPKPSPRWPSRTAITPPPRATAAPWPKAAPDRFEHWFNLGVACHKMGAYDKAMQAYKHAVVAAARQRADLPQPGRHAAGIERSGRRPRQLRDAH